MYSQFMMHGQKNIKLLMNVCKHGERNETLCITVLIAAETRRKE